MPVSYSFTVLIKFFCYVILYGTQKIEELEVQGAALYSISQQYVVYLLFCSLLY